MVLTIKVQTNFQDVAAALDSVRRQVPFAASRAINATAVQVQQALRDELPRVFDRPTPYIRNSIRITRWANKAQLYADIEPAYLGGKGVDPQNVLRAEVFGGARRLKRSEVALQRAGILPAGYMTAPGKACPLDQFGNVRGSFIVQLLSYFQAFGEQGYRANMTDKRKKQLAKGGRRSARGFKQIAGVEYFVSYGRLRGGKGAWLAPGIWSRSGIHGSTIKPILMFVRAANYRPRFDFMGLAERVVHAEWPRQFAASFEQAMETAR